MNLKYSLLYFLLCVTVGLSAQQLKLESTPRGIFISIDNSPPNITGWTVEREGSRDLPEQRWTLAVANEEEAYRGRLIQFNELFPDGAVLPSRLIDSLWQLRTGNRPINHPAYLLAEGRAIVDKEVQAGESYTYRLIAPDGKRYNKASLHYPEPVRLPQLSLVATETGQYPLMRWQADRVADLWSAKVFRQDPVSGRFQRVAAEVLTFRNLESDTVSVVVKDTTLQEYGYWRYYIQATDRFGNTGPAAEVGHVLWLDQAALPAIYQLEATAVKEKPEIELNWQIEHPERIRAIKLFRSQSYSGDFELLATLPASTRTFTDLVNQSGEAYFYYLEAVDLAAQPWRSAIVSEAFKGKLAVEAPLSVKANKQERGILVEWKGTASRDYGYLVYRANGHRGELALVSNLLRTLDQGLSFLDTSANLRAGEQYSYAVKAVSGSNDQSEFSDRASVQAPGEVIIPAPRNLKSRSRGGELVLSWEALNARVPGVIGYHVYRRLEVSDTFQRMTPRLLDLSNNRYRISLDGKDYEYGVRAVDYSGREGLMNQTRPAELQQLLDLRPEQLQAARTREGIKLAWTPLPFPLQTQAVQIYRSAGDDLFLLLAEPSPDTTEYLDRTTLAGQRYRYYLVVKDQLGNLSSPTRMIGL